MSKFSKRHFSQSQIQESDIGISVKEVIDLAQNNRFYAEISGLLDIDSISDEFIQIPGASTLVKTIKAQNAKYEKFDLKCDYQNLAFSTNEKGDFIIKFTNIEDPDALRFTNGSSSVTAELIYSSRSDFFASTFNMDKYAKKLLDSGNSELVMENLDALRKKFVGKTNHIKYYRLLKDAEGKFYLRGIVSSQYNDYDNTITVFLGLICLHNEMKNTSSKFSVNRCEYNESFVRIFFEKIDKRPIENVGVMEYFIELSNDEIKRESLRFSGAMSIVYEDSNSSLEGIYIKPNNLTSNITAISHGLGPEKAAEKLATFSEYASREREMYDDAKTISEITEPDQIRGLIEDKVRKIKQNDLKKHRDKILRELNVRVNSMHGLFTVLNKVDLIVADIEAKEYLRYLLYEGIIKRKGS